MKSLRFSRVGNKNTVESTYVHAEGAFELRKEVFLTR